MKDTKKEQQKINILEIERDVHGVEYHGWGSYCNEILKVSKIDNYFIDRYVGDGKYECWGDITLEGILILSKLLMKTYKDFRRFNPQDEYEG